MAKQPSKPARADSSAGGSAAAVSSTDAVASRTGRDRFVDGGAVRARERIGALHPVVAGMARSFHVR
jgi:hypothetical protein